MTYSSKPLNNAISPENAKNMAEELRYLEPQDILQLRRALNEMSLKDLLIMRENIKAISKIIHYIKYRRSPKGNKTAAAQYQRRKDIKELEAMKPDE